MPAAMVPSSEASPVWASVPPEPEPLPPVWPPLPEPPVSPGFSVPVPEPPPGSPPCSSSRPSMASLS